jgi:hypothetical protein
MADEERDQTEDQVSEEELEQANGEELPDREVMTVISAPIPGGGTTGLPPEHFSE